MNPFFTKRRPAGQKQGSGAAGAADGGLGEGAGTAGAAGALGGKRTPLGEMMPPIHVRQLEGAQVCAAGPGVGGADRALWQLLRARACEQAPVAARSAGSEAAGAGSQTEAEATGPNGSVADAAMVRLQEAIAAEQSRSSAAGQPHVAGCSFWPCWPTGQAAAAAAAATEAARPAAGMPRVGVEEAAGRAGLPLLAEGGATGDSSLLRQLASRLAAEAGATAGCSQDPAVSLHWMQSLQHLCISGAAPLPPLFLLIPILHELLLCVGCAYRDCRHTLCLSPLCPPCSSRPADGRFLCGRCSRPTSAAGRRPNLSYSGTVGRLFRPLP